MKVKYFFPLIGFVVPTVVIGCGFVIPNSQIAGINALTIGFASTIVGACAAYVTGVWTILGDRPSSDGDVPPRVARKGWRRDVL
jgi:hypothetical protein